MSALLASTFPLEAVSQEFDIYFVHSDHLSTPQKLTDESGTIVWAADYQPFGDVALHVSVKTNKIRFPGQYFDAETGFHYNYFRDYDSNTGRYLQSDPIGLDGGTSTYLYAIANPLIAADPLGLTAGALPWVEPIFRPIPLPMSPVDPVLPLPDIDWMPGGTPKDPFGEYCRSLARRIQNLRNEIYNKRIPELDINSGELPERLSPHEDLRDTVRGHRKLWNRADSQLRKAEKEYAQKCVPMASACKL